MVVAQTVFAGTDGTVRGRITDVEQSPLPGAQIYIPELEQGAIADIDGNYIVMQKALPLPKAADVTDKWYRKIRVSTIIVSF